MEKLKSIPLVLLCLYGIKGLVIASNLNDILTLAAISVVFIFIEHGSMYQQKKKFDLELADIKAQVEELTKSSENIKTNISSIKLSQSFKQGTR